jgi:phage protein U
MFALLGEIPFRVIGSPESIESERGYDYAEHRVVGARPRLQWLAGGLERIELELMLHRSFTDPALQFARLSTAADAHRALALVFGNGEFRGYFVIESISARSTQHGAGGEPIAMTLRLRLKEWAPERGAARRPRPVTRPLGIIERARGSLAGLPAAAPIGLSEFAPAPTPTEAGLSALLRLIGRGGVSSAALRPGDVATATITRSRAG